MGNFSARHGARRTRAQLAHALGAITIMVACLSMLILPCGTMLFGTNRIPLLTDR
jgi:hypothetical protein